ncbi:hypothetical protein GHT06_009182 [Daphnia sinensis]|uniref:C2H2-type domain-containing protein n=1 Tax=Daphnia sinensis TaxID=1820382 RepID=A0AAD5LME8_9CRUS|nr:hypothetical protein GHT06_009182 [Daphnia sinensis]
MDFVFEVCNGSVLESNSSESWTQLAIEKELEKRIRQVCDEIRVLEERKLNLPCLALSPAGILAQWLFKKYCISGNNLMENAIRSVWQGISEEARLQLYCESLRQTEKVQQQASAIKRNIEKLRVQLKCLTEKLSTQEEKTACVKLEYFCIEPGCGKIFQSRDSFAKHRNRNHPWQIIPSVTCTSGPVVPSVFEPSVVVPPKVPPSKVSSFKSVTPRLGLYKRPGPQLCVGQAKLPKQTVDFVSGSLQDAKHPQEPSIVSTGKGIRKRLSPRCYTSPGAPIVDTGIGGFPSEIHLRANEAKKMRDRPNGRNVILLCDCPAVRNVVTHVASHILNRGADYFWCSRKAIKKVGQSVKELSPAQLAEYRKCCNFFGVPRFSLPRKRFLCSFGYTQLLTSVYGINYHGGSKSIFNNLRYFVCLQYNLQSTLELTELLLSTTCHFVHMQHE